MWMKLFLNKFILFSTVAVLLLGVGCKKNPISRLNNPAGSNNVAQSSGFFTIFDEELKTGGGLGFIPSGANQTINLESPDGPFQGRFVIAYTWNGGDVLNDGVLQHAFAGFSLSVSPDLSTLDSATARDLSNPGYTKMTFKVRGSLSANTTLRVEGPDDGTGGNTAERIELGSSQVNPVWGTYEIGIPASHFSSIKTFATFSFQYDQPPRSTVSGNGGIIFLDEIRYER